MRGAKRALILTLSWIAFAALNPPPALAHPLDLGYLELQTEGESLRVFLDMDAKGAVRFAPPSGSDAPAILQSTLGTAEFAVDGKRCEWLHPDTPVLSGQMLHLGGTFLCDTRQGRLLTVRLPFLAQAPPTYQVLGKAKFGTTERSFLAEPQSFEVSLPFDSASPTRFGEFLLMGIRHIGAAPGEWVDSRGLHLPDGIDHILFLLALILGGGGFWKILQTATGFTLGHSVTLALASLGVVKLPGRVVESAIALSIVYVAVEAFRKRDGEGRWKIAALFGLVHGFGFATALNELALGRAAMVRALVGFNLGVECGQALLIALILPWIYLAKSRPAFHEVSLRACSCAIGLAGSYWFLERAFGLSL